MRVLIVDMGSVYGTHWHATADEDRNRARELSVGLIRREAEGFDRVIVCCDSRKNFRRSIFAGYKANREVKPPQYYEQLRRAELALMAEGYVVAHGEALEADDVAASAVAVGRERGWSMTVISADKDLLQLLGEGVVIQTMQGEQRDAEWLRSVWGVRPDQVPDVLALVGDKSDNLPGVKSCGMKRACLLLQVFDHVGDIAEAAKSAPEEIASVAGIPASITEQLSDPAVRSTLVQVRQLAQLRVDLDCIDVAKVEAEPVPTIIDSETAPPEDTMPSSNHHEEYMADTEAPSSSGRREGGRYPTLDMQWSPECGAIAEAIAKAQAEVQPVKKSQTADVKTSKGPGYSYNYATLGDIMVAARPFAKHGVAIIQRPMAQQLETLLMHGSGQWVRCTTPLEYRGGGPQVYGSAATYARRYALAAICMIPLDDDDDGAAAQNQYRSRGAA